MIIRKSDGGYNYSTTDLATVRYRVDKVNVRPGRSTSSARTRRCTSGWSSRWRGEAGWLPAGDRFEHAQIGMVQGKDGHRLRTRAGDTVKLSDLLTEGVERARAILDEVERDDEGLDLDAIAEDVGIGAIKYADLSTARDSAYIFDWDRMISFKGNTGPVPPVRDDPDQVDLPPGGRATRPDAQRPDRCVTEPAERELARKLLGFGAVVTQVADTAEPHRLCALPVRGRQPVHHVLRAVPGAQGRRRGDRQSRLALCAAVLRVLTTGLGLLGVPLPDRM